jgi:hypothetical protein
LTSGVPIPRNQTDLTPEWFSTILNTPVKTVKLQPLGETDSVSGFIYRANLTYKTKQHDNPKSLIIKTPHPKATRPPILTTLYKRELNFYKTLAPKMKLKIPQAFYSDIDNESDKYILVLEDFPHHTPGKNSPGATLQQTNIILEQMAKLHANWWQSPELANYKFLGSLEEFITRYTREIPKRLPLFLKRFESEIPSDDLPIFKALPSKFSAIASPLLGAPQTLIHHDLSLKNTLIREDSSGVDVVLIDWQLAYWNTGVRDVSFFIGISVAPDVRSKCEVEFLRYYWERLRLEGIVGYSFEELWGHYRRAVVCDLARLVFIGGNNVEMSGVMRSLLEHGIRGRSGSTKQLELQSLILAP